MGNPITVRLLGPGDQSSIEQADGLFDNPVSPVQTRAFLASDRDFLWFAICGVRAVGFVSATSLLHPDKSPHLFVNELATHRDYRRRGVATRLMEHVVEFGRARGLWPIWLASEGDDAQAIAFYRSLDEMAERGAIVFETQ